MPEGSNLRRKPLGRNVFTDDPTDEPVPTPAPPQPPPTAPASRPRALTQPAAPAATRRPPTNTATSIPASEIRRALEGVTVAPDQLHERTKESTYLYLVLLEQLEAVRSVARRAGLRRKISRSRLIEVATEDLMARLLEQGIDETLLKRLLERPADQHAAPQD